MPSSADSRGYNKKEASELTRDWEKKYIPNYPSLLADQNEGGQPNWASEITIQGNMRQ
jgi:hypothetical protein